MKTTTTQHTPGPWQTGTKERGRFCVYSTATHGRGICVMSNTQKTWGEREVAKFGEHELNLEADANARLIAAAPDLLDQLEALVFRFGHNDSPEDLAALDEARSAIQRATEGRT